MPPGPPPPRRKEALQLNEQQLNDPRCLGRGRSTPGLDDRRPPPRFICAGVGRPFATSRPLKGTRTASKEKASRWPQGSFGRIHVRWGRSQQTPAPPERQIRRIASNDDADNFPSGELKRLQKLSSSFSYDISLLFQISHVPPLLLEPYQRCLFSLQLWLFRGGSSLRLLTAVESVLQLERDMRSASSYEGSLLSSEHLVYRSRVCGLTRECKTECLTGAILHVHLVKGPPRWFGKRRVLEKKNQLSVFHM